MSKPAMHIDRFDTTSHLRKGARTYEAVKAAALAAGRFSIFEAQDDPGTFMRLIRDPEVEKVEMPYPWVGVRNRAYTASAPHDDPVTEIEP